MKRAVHRQAGLSVLLLALLGLPSLAVPAQSQPSDDARRFLVYPPNKIISFQENDSTLYLHYDGLQQDKGRDGKGNPLLYNQVVQVTRYLEEEQAVAACKAVLGVPLKGKTVRMIDGFPCAFVQETTDGSGARITYYRSSWYTQGRYFVSLGETARSAVGAGSVVVGVAVDKAMEKAQVAQAMANAALKAPSFVGSLITPPDGPSEPGGIDLSFDR